MGANPRDADIIYRLAHFFLRKKFLLSSADMDFREVIVICLLTMDYS